MEDEPRLGGHDFQTLKVTNTSGKNVCDRSATAVRHGCRIKRCKNCHLAWCPDCLKAHGDTASMPKCSTRCEEMAAGKRGKDGSETALLEEWCSEPAPGTLPYLPRNLRQRVSWLLQTQLDEAVAVSKRAAAGTEADKLDALHAHRRLWALPSLLLRAPFDGEEAKHGSAGALPRQRVIQARVQQMELGNWI